MLRVVLLCLVVAFTTGSFYPADRREALPGFRVLFNKKIKSGQLSIIGKPTAQSTTHNENYTSDKAVDGSQGTYLYPNNVCSHTGEEAHPWWRVDLEEEHCISKVTILNRGDCCSDRLTNAVVRAGMNDDVITNHQCGSAVTADQAQPLGGTIEFACESPLRARYTSVDIPTGGYLQLCEVTVFELPLESCLPPAIQSGQLSIIGKPTAQSTTFIENYTSDKAVDGSPGTYLYPNNVCSHTGEEDHPWWRVDLEEEHCISKVTILNRGDCCSDRLTNAVVRAGMNDDVITNHQCGSAVTADQALPLGGTIEFACESPLRARYTSVDIPTGGYLQLCEVTVFELPLESCLPPAIKSGQLSIIGKPTAQSTTFIENYTSDKAVDGSPGTFLYPNNVCSHTGEEDHPWWRVDLEEEHCISKVTILNRGDCCSDRLTNAVVRAGLNDDVITNHQCGSAVTADQAQPLGGTIEFACESPLRARYISVDIPTGGYLQLCEVTVFELPLESCLPPAIQSGQLSIVGKPTAQSTTHNENYTSDKAVDGSQGTYLYPNNVCSHTGEEAHPWWRVDLEEEHCISKVTILNRGDCCSDRLRMQLLPATCEVTVFELPLESCLPPAIQSGQLSIVGKPTAQSTTHNENYTSDKAVDGSQGTYLYPNNVCSHTGEEDHPWWRVDLEEEHCISKVTILNRGDCCSDRLTNAVVRAGLNDDVITNHQCGSAVTADQAQPLGGTIEFACESPLRARYISVDIPTGGYLQLCEVTVFELPLESCLPPAIQSGQLSIVGKPTAQSTTHNENYTSDKAVDGSQGTYLYPNNVCSHTGEEAHPWWRVDLEEEHCISKVTILNRGDCCSDRLTNAVVRAGLNDDVITNHQCGSAVTADQAQPLGGTIEFACESPLRAQYISVDIPTGGYLQLCEVTVFELPLESCLPPAIQSGQLSIVGKPTAQSTTHNENYTSDKAVDGSQGTYLYPNNVCSHTGEEDHPWWRVDLEEEHCISKVTILNRGDCCSDRLTNAVVRAGLNDDVITNHQCGSAVTADQAQPLGGTIEFACESPLRARYISVDIPTGGYLQLCEVTVFELPLESCLPPAIQSGQLSIIGKPTAQSTTIENYTSDKAVDGSQGTYLYPNNVCSHTGEEEHPWWRVDLEEEHCISKVTILNRGDCCSDRLTNAVVRAGLNDDVITNHQCGSAVTADQAQPLGGTIEFACESPLRARYISVDIPTGGYLQLCEVTVFELPLESCLHPAIQSGQLSIIGKPTAQSTTIENYTSDKAVDGSQGTYLYPNNVCSHTGEEDHPWWRVDLEEEHCISKVTILNRGDCCSDRLTNAVVRAGLNDDVITNHQCGSAVTADQAQPLGGTIEFACESPLRARYTSVDIPTGGYLQLCEVTVFELPLESCLPPAIQSGQLSIVGKPTAQSTTHNENYTSDKAVDGSQGTYLYPNNVCSHTGEEDHPWWRVDLEEEHCISKVTILNRGDCCSDRLTNAVVRAGLNVDVITNHQCGSAVTADQAQPLGGTIEFACESPLRARYISVDIPTGGYLQLCEVTVEKLPLDRCPESAVRTSGPLSIVGLPTEQSTTYLPNYSSDKSVDGSRDTRLYSKNNSCSQTGKEYAPWWRVYLKGVYTISKVSILHRGDCCRRDSLEGAVVRAGFHTSVTQNEQCGSTVTAEQSAVTSGTIEFVCDPPLRARYISVDVQSKGGQHLQLCEVTVEQVLSPETNTL
ncbi:uncharacterized protein LOC117294678 [Asterias rubens]|uniref:uncharacterized protein LOC117294678 n=1 Tax=Asterias rubens TaxID=7604 RepID=UPI0014556180|nr:uncharacterized protein LOC117294678 [Asterias rubens]